MIKEKKKPKMINSILETIIQDNDILHTPITPSSPRFNIYYDFVYIP